MAGVGPACKQRECQSCGFGVTVATWSVLNKQLRAFGIRLRNDVGLTERESGRVASLVAADVRFLPSAVKAEIRATSPVPISARLDELIAFQSWMELASSLTGHAEVTRAQVITQNYICFVYLKDACFEVLNRRCAKDSLAARCGSYSFERCRARLSERVLPRQLVL